jgi:hypothetical protein
MQFGSLRIFYSGVYGNSVREFVEILFGSLWKFVLGRGNACAGRGILLKWRPDHTLR